MDERHRALNDAIAHLKAMQQPKETDPQIATLRAKVMRVAPRTCARCGKEYMPPSGYGPTCSGSCRKAFWRSGYRDPNWYTNMEN